MAEGHLQLWDSVHFHVESHLYGMELGSRDYQNGQRETGLEDWYCVERSRLHHQCPCEVRNKVVNEVIHDEIRKEVQEKMGAMKQEMMRYCELEIKTQLDEMLTPQCLALGMQLEEMATVLHQVMMMGANPRH